MRKVSLDLVQNRKAHPEDKKDLLNAMLNGRDPKTGEALSEDSIVDNMITVNDLVWHVNFNPLTTAAVPHRRARDHFWNALVCVLLSHQTSRGIQESTGRS